MWNLKLGPSESALYGQLAGTTTSSAAIAATPTTTTTITSAEAAGPAPTTNIQSHHHLHQHRPQQKRRHQQSAKIMQKLHYRPAPSEGSGRSPKICNSNVDESVYIKMIRQERPLWDKKHRDYKNLEVKNQIWKEIAEKCASTDLECKRRWTGLREKYRREKILNYKQRRLGQVVDLTQRWRNYVNMEFLDQVYTPRGNYQKSNGSTSVEERDDSGPAQEIKFEEDDSGDDCNVADFLETNMSNNAMSLSESPANNFTSPSSSQLAQLTAQNINGNNSIFSNLSSDRLVNGQDNFPRIWVNSLPNLPMLSRHLKGDESSSSSQQSDPKVHPPHTDTNTNNHDVFGINKTANKYTSFGQYIADTLQGMDEKYANELHVHILEEIIKIKSKIFKES